MDVCRKEQPFEIKTKRRESVLEESPVSPASDMETESTEASTSRTPASPGSVDPNQPSTSSGVTHDKLIPQNPTKTGKSRGLLWICFYVRSLWDFFALCISVHASYGMLDCFQCYINEVICIVGSCLSKSWILELVASTTCDLNSAIMFNCGSIVLNRMWWIEGEKEHYILMLFSLP